MTTLLGLLVAALLGMQLHCGHAFQALQVSPSTPPEEIVSAQLLALEQGDMRKAFDFLSPLHKSPFGAFQGKDGIQSYSHMMQSKGVVGKQSNILLVKRTLGVPSRDKDDAHLKQLVGKLWVKPHEMWTEDRCDLLVRMAMVDNQKEKEYWWTLSRWTGPGKQLGCYFVEDIRPNKGPMCHGDRLVGLLELVGCSRTANE